MPVDDVLLGIVLRRLNLAPLPDEATSLLLAALEGEEALSAQLSAAQVSAAQVGADPAGHHRVAGSPAQAAAPVGAYLRSLTVGGFRGIGPPATLEVLPGPGLTLVVGRNGSGKSSFAEAVEVLLTGALMRYGQAPAVVRDGWRSKHAADATGIQAEFLIEGSGQAVAARTWTAGAGLGDSGAWLQRHGEKRRDLGELGWADALTEYRPFLSHTELEAFFVGRPSELHDLLASVLGLEDLAAAAARLNVARKQREDALATIRQRLNLLRERLGELDDERARVCLAALAGQSWDIAAAKVAATGAEPPDGGQLDLLRRLAQLSMPASADVSHAVAGLREAAGGLAEVAGTAAGQALALASLLEAALAHQQAHGADGCPVCGRPGALTPEWRTATREHLDRLREEAAAAEAAAAASKRAADQALALAAPPPAFLAGPGVAGLDLRPAREAWTGWARRPSGADLTTPAGLRSLADHLDRARATLDDAVTALAAGAARELSRRDDRWAPLAADVASWCADAEPALAAAKPVASVKRARTWLTGATADLRDERLAPLADQARAIWTMLRQESNVDLRAFRLTGAATQRKLELDVSIDGSPGAALGVMSQGEINALALSIFLPRATMPQSPFRFLIIDDPVQAMDPAKVDGLARVLERVAADRQVIVFTHDNRLASAVVDLDIRATVLEVTRRPGSIVQVRRCLDPVQQALKDAGALHADRGVPVAVARRVIPGLCRSAVEAAFTQAVWCRQLRDGRTRDAIGAALTDARQFTRLAALAMFGDPGQGSKVLPRLDGMGRLFADTFRALNRGAHQPHPGDLGQLIADSRRLTAKIRETLSDPR